MILLKCLTNRKIHINLSHMCVQGWITHQTQIKLRTFLQGWITIQSRLRRLTDVQGWNTFKMTKRLRTFQQGENRCVIKCQPRCKYQLHSHIFRMEQFIYKLSIKKYWRATIVRFNKAKEYYTVRYDDNNGKELTHEDITAYQIPPENKKKNTGPKNNPAAAKANE